MDNQQDGKGIIPIPFMSDYFTDGNGNIYSTKRNKLKKLTCYKHFGRSRNPYLRVKIAVEFCVGKLYLSHRLIASVHVNRELKDHEYVNHKNGNTTDNSLSNLEIVSHKDNVKHAVKYGLYCSGKEWYKARTSSSTISKESTPKQVEVQSIPKG